MFLIAGCGKAEGDAKGGGELELYVLSPHGADIRREFAEGFSGWHEKHFGGRVKVRWPDIGGGGTGNLMTYLDKTKGNSGNDVMFGGGSESFIVLGAAGYLEKPLAMGEAEGKVFGADPIDGVPADIFGTPLHGKNGEWVGAAMSSFGIVVNKERVGELGLSLPRVWEDIAGPAWVGRVSVADPVKSGSVKTSYEMIFQQYGWEKGWEVLVRIFANASAIREGGANPAEDVGSAEAVAGIVIDFYGRIHITRAGSAVVGFVVPAGGSTLDPDPIAVLKGAAHRELAGRFVRYVVSPEGQRLWTFKPGVAGGPRKSALGRLSVLPTLYEKEVGSGGGMLDGTNPFTGPKPLVVDGQGRGWRGKFMGELVKAALVDNEEEMVAARRAILKAGDPPELLRRLTALPRFEQVKVEDGRLVGGEVKELKVGDQAAVAGLMSPAAGSPLAGYAEQVRAGLMDRWRREFRERFAELRREAEAMRP